MTATQRYELIRPIVQKEKTVQQVHQETDISVRTLHRYIKRFREGGQQIESLADKSSAPHSHPKWKTSEEKARVVQYKLENPPISARQISRDLAEKGILKINHHSVADLLKERGLTGEFFLSHHPTPRQMGQRSFQRKVPSKLTPLKRLEKPPQRKNFSLLRPNAWTIFPFYLRHLSRWEFPRF